MNLAFAARFAASCEQRCCAELPFREHQVSLQPKPSLVAFAAADLGGGSAHLFTRISCDTPAGSALFPRQKDKKNPSEIPPSRCGISHQDPTAVSGISHRDPRRLGGISHGICGISRFKSFRSWDHVKINF